MKSYPAYLPVLAVSACSEVHRSLFKRLMHRLAEAGIRVAVEPAGDCMNEPDGATAGIMQSLVRNDLVIIDAGPVQGAALLVLGPSLATGVAEETEVVFTCTAENELAACVDSIIRWLARCQDNTPVWGCILIGGKSSRMGCPKHLITTATGETWLERAVKRLAPFVEEIVISGAGELPDHLEHLKRIQDLPGVSGPLSGLGAVLRSYPLVSWLLLACDMPDVSAQSVSWLLGQRRPGMAAVIPHNLQSDHSEPLYGWYDFRSLVMVEHMLAAGQRRIGAICEIGNVYQPVIPKELAASWRNINRQEEI